jgi:hypothetical protein
VRDSHVEAAGGEAESEHGRVVGGNLRILRELLTAAKETEAAREVARAPNLTISQSEFTTTNEEAREAASCPPERKTWSVLWGMRVFVKSTQRFQFMVEGGKKGLDATSLSSGLVCFSAAGVGKKT